MTFHEALSRVEPLLREIDALPDTWADDDWRSSDDPREAMPPMRQPPRRPIEPLAVAWHEVSKRDTPPPPPTIAEAVAMLAPRVTDSHGAAEVLRMVCDEMGVTPAEMAGKSTFRPIVAARTVAAWLMRTRLKMKFDAIGRAMGRTHGYAIEACQRAARAIGGEGV